MQSWLRAFTSSAPATRGWRALLVVLMAVVAWLALTPLPPRAIDLGWDKLNHASAFAALAVAGWLSVRGRRGRWPTMALLLVYGALIEVAQRFVPGRSGEWSDLLADALGIGVGVLVASALLALAPTGLKRPAGSPGSPRTD